MIVDCRILSIFTAYPSGPHAFISNSRGHRDSSRVPSSKLDGSIRTRGFTNRVQEKTAVETWMIETAPEFAVGRGFNKSMCNRHYQYPHHGICGHVSRISNGGEMTACRIAKSVDCSTDPALLTKRRQ